MPREHCRSPALPQPSFGTATQSYWCTGKQRHFNFLRHPFPSFFYFFSFLSLSFSPSLSASRIFSPFPALLVEMRPSTEPSCQSSRETARRCGIFFFRGEVGPQTWVYKCDRTSDGVTPEPYRPHFVSSQALMGRFQEGEGQVRPTSGNAVEEDAEEVARTSTQLRTIVIRFERDRNSREVPGYPGLRKPTVGVVSGKER